MGSWELSGSLELGVGSGSWKLGVELGVGWELRVGSELGVKFKSWEWKLPQS